jgi:hypothetical protein
MACLGRRADGTSWLNLASGLVGTFGVQASEPLLAMGGFAMPNHFLALAMSTLNCNSHTDTGLA